MDVNDAHAGEGEGANVNVNEIIAGSGYLPVETVALLPCHSPEPISPSLFRVPFLFPSP